MLLPTLPGLLTTSIILAPVHAQLTFWIDSSCPQGWNDIVKESVYMNSRGLTRLSAQDPNQGRAFEFLWQVPPSDATAGIEVHSEFL